MMDKYATVLVTVVEASLPPFAYIIMSEGGGKERGVKIDVGMNVLLCIMHAWMHRWHELRLSLEGAALSLCSSLSLSLFFRLPARSLARLPACLSDTAAVFVMNFATG